MEPLNRAALEYVIMFVAMYYNASCVCRSSGTLLMDHPDRRDKCDSQFLALLIPPTLEI